MEKIIYILLCAIVGGTLAELDANVSDWSFWIVLGCMCASNICGHISGMKSNT